MPRSAQIRPLAGEDNLNHRNPERSSTWVFFLLAFGLSWVLWILAALLGADSEAVLPQVLHYAGGLVPFAVTVALLFLRHTPDFRQDFWRRAVDFKRIGIKWYGVVLLTVPVLTALGALVDKLLGGGGWRLEAAGRFAQEPWLFVPFAVFILVFGPLPEELAWRGYALDGLQTKWKALTASLVLGAAWTVWHLPLFFIQGTYQHGLGLGTEQFWLYLLDKVPLSILMTWVYNNNRRSTLSAILFHFMVNLVGELFDLTLRAEAIYILLWIAAAIGVTAFWGPESLVRGKPRE